MIGDDDDAREREVGGKQDGVYLFQSKTPAGDVHNCP